MAVHEIDLDGAELNICYEYVDEIWIDKLKKVLHSTV